MGGEEQSEATKLERDFISDALDMVIESAEAARELCEVGVDYEKGKVMLHLAQAAAALQCALGQIR